MRIKTIPVDGPSHFDYLQEAGQREIENEEGLIILPGLHRPRKGNLTLNYCF